MSAPSSAHQRLSSAVASYRGEMLAFTRDLIHIPTENPPGRHYRKCAEAIWRRLDQMGLEPELLEVRGSEVRGSESYPRCCLQSFYGQGARILYFHGHYDVVPAASLAQFEPLVDDGRLYGRGSSDMKSGLSAMIYALKAIKDCGLDLDGRIGLTIVPDEETGGAGGSRYLAEMGLLGKGGIGMLMPEPTSGAIWNANRGALSLKVTVKGKPAHVGLQHEGVNAFERMLAVARALQGLKAEVESRETAYQVSPAEARRSIVLLGGQCGGGSNFNLVPGECWFTVDRRPNPEEDLKVEKARLFAVLDGLRAQGIDLDVEVLQEANSAGVPEMESLGQALAETVASVTGRRPAFEMCPGVTELRFYAEQGIPAFLYGPGILSVSHGPEEYVEVERIAECALIYALAAHKMLTPH